MTNSANKPCILAIDDTPDNLSLVSAVLRDTYRVKAANNGEKGLSIALSDDPPDLILLDVMMPDLDGHEVCRRLKADPRSRDIPVIFLTAQADVENEQLGLSLGAVDYIVKPLNPPILMARVKTHLRLKEAKDFLANQNRILEARVAERTQQLADLQDVTMVALGSLAETRDSETGNHIRHTQHYMRILALALRGLSRFADYLTDEMIALLFKTAPLHDIGKVGVPDQILLKPGKLTAEEFERMKLHAAYGRDAIRSAVQLSDEPPSFLQLASEITYSHHEKWDGSGYPEGMTEEEIPVSARLMAVADVYDALISRRVYKPPMTHAEAMDIIMKGRGTHFDSDMADAFAEMSDEILEISRRFSDSD